MPAATNTPTYPIGPEAKLPSHPNYGAAPTPTAAADAALAALWPDASRTLIAGESAEEFEALVKAIVEFWRPQNVIEQLDVTDYISAQWELLRVRRMVPAVFIAGRPFAVSDLLGLEDRFCESPFPTGRYNKTLAMLAEMGHTPEILDAHVLLRQAAAFESFDKRAAMLEVRRDRALEKLERRRSEMKTISSAALPERTADE